MYKKNSPPDFTYLEKVFARQVTDRPVLFDYGINLSYCERLSGEPLPKGADAFEVLKKIVEGHAAAGYDYAIDMASNFRLRPLEKQHELKQSISANDAPLITDWKSFEEYSWQNPSDFNYEKMIKIKECLPAGMKMISDTPGGILENLMDLTGFDNLCIMLYEEPELIEAIVENIGKRFYAYCEIVLQMETVEGIFFGDDWGFNTQTFLSPDDLRKYIFPWHKRVVDLAHKYNKYCILHSCGYFGDVMEDIIQMRYDARHSYEDNIIPVEEAYEQYGDRIGVLGGIDVNYLCHESPESIKKRCRKMLERTMERGGYALGTGNSVPEYIPYENYRAMLQTAREF